MMLCTSFLNDCIYCILGYGSILTCTSCPKVFTSKVTLSRHCMWHHKDTQKKYKFNCLKCPYSTNYNTNYSGHLVVHIPNKLFRCPVCDNGFDTQRDLSKHTIIHTGDF